MIIDSHVHIGKLSGGLYAESYEKNLELVLKEAKENGVDHLIILAGLEKEDGFNLTTQSLIDLTANHKSVHTVAGININYDKDYLTQLENWLIDKQIVGIKFYTGYQHYYPSDERCNPIYDIALKYDVPVIFHSGDTLAGYVSNPKVRYSHPLNIDDVAADLPDLKIIIAHMGNPWLVDCGELLYKNPNVYADISGLIVGEDLDSPYGDLMRSKIKEMIHYIGSENKLLYGTDWPLAPMKTYIKFAQSLNLSKEGQDNLFYKNALKLFKLND
jgi:uncharacterized protein